MEHLPAFIAILFCLTTLLCFAGVLLILKKSTLPSIRRQTPDIAICLLVWLSLQAFFAHKGIYSNHTEKLPPRIVLVGILPAVLGILFLFLTKKGRYFIDSLPLGPVTAFHMVRIPVELVLFYLFVHKAVPQLMTFEGRNFDIIAGITAPIAAYLWVKGKLWPKLLLAWNILCLGLLLNIVINALLSAPSPLQQFVFDQPNIAILYFPFVWLPVFIVPAVLLGHLVAIRKLYRNK